MNIKQAIDSCVWFHPVTEISVRFTRLSDSPGMLSKPNFSIDIRNNLFSVGLVSKWNSMS